MDAGAQLDVAYAAQISKFGITTHRGTITAIHHDEGKMHAVTLDSGEKVDVGTLLWTTPERHSPLVDNLVNNLDLELNQFGHVSANEMQQTNIDRLWAAGDVQGCTGAIESAYAGGMAAFLIAHGWYGKARVD